MNQVQSNYVTTLAACITAKQQHAKALEQLIAHHRGKRTVELCEDIVAALRIAFPQTDACVGAYAGQPCVSFPKKGAGYQFYCEEIRSRLPALRKATGGKRKAAKQSGKRARVSVKQVVAAYRGLSAAEKREFLAAIVG